jgi:glycine cleavage system H protein
MRSASPVRGDLYYDIATHVWADWASPIAVRVGLDPIGADTSGDIVALSFAPAGTEIRRGEAFGSLEAAKFVGPLIAPVSGVIRAHNRQVLVRPGDINRDPFATWLVELELTDSDELADLLTGEAEVAAWLERERRHFRHKGMLAQ